MAKKGKKETRRVGREKVDKDAKTRSGGGKSTFRLPTGMETFVPEGGKTYRFDILPYEVTDSNHPDSVEVGDLWYKRPFKTHKRIGIDETDVVCPRSIGKKCPICDYRAKLKKKGSADEDLIDTLRPKDRVLYNIRPRSAKKSQDDSEVKIFEISRWNFQHQFYDELNLVDEDEDDSKKDFAELEGGKTLKASFKKASYGAVTYPQAWKFEFLDRKDYDDDILDSVANLDELLIVLSYKELEKMFLELEGGADEEEDEEDEEGTDGEDIDEDAEEEEEEEEEKPSKKSGGKKGSGKKSGKKKEKKPDKDEEEEEEEEPDNDDDEEEEEEEEPEEEEEEEEEPPKKSGKKKSSSSEKKSGAKKDGGNMSRSSKKDSSKKTEAESKKASGKSKEKDSDNKCPHGHIFGDDCERFDDCDDCKKWKQCVEAS